MSFIQIFSLVLLVVVFGLAIWRHMNIGLATIAGTFVLMLVAGVPVADVFTPFPVSLVILILGVTFLFGHAQRSGIIDRIIGVAVRVTGSRDWALPWLMFLIAAVLSAVGVLPAGALAITVPVAMRTAHLRGISPALMGIVTICGGLAGGFSPVSVWGQLLATAASQDGRSLPGGAFFGILFGLNLLLAIAAFVVFGGHRLIRRRSTARPDRTTEPEEAPSAGSSHDPPSDGGGSVATRQAPARTRPTARRTTAYQVCSGLAVVLFICSVLIVKTDVGLTAFSLAALVQIVFRPAEKEVIAALPWGVVLVISGVLLYVGLMEHLGTFQAIADHLGGIGSQAVLFLALAVVGSLFGVLEPSAVAVLGVMGALALRVTPGLDGPLLLLFLCQLSWAVVAVSASPYHLSGGLVLATAPEDEQPRLFRQLLVWTLAVAVAVPLVGWVLPLLGPS